jgi:hypothetical protein
LLSEQASFRIQNPYKTLKKLRESHAHAFLHEIRRDSSFAIWSVPGKLGLVLKKLVIVADLSKLGRHQGISVSMILPLLVIMTARVLAANISRKRVLVRIHSEPSERDRKTTSTVQIATLAPLIHTQIVGLLFPIYADTLNL